MVKRFEQVLSWKANGRWGLELTQQRKLWVKCLQEETALRKSSLTFSPEKRRGLGGPRPQGRFKWSVHVDTAELPENLQSKHWGYHVPHTPCEEPIPYFSTQQLRRKYLQAVTMSDNAPKQSFLCSKLPSHGTTQLTSQVPVHRAWGSTLWLPLKG